MKMLPTGREIVRFQMGPIPIGPRDDALTNWVELNLCDAIFPARINKVLTVESPSVRAESNDAQILGQPG